MNCKYCDKELKNKRALVQHEIRCINNPNRLKYEVLKCSDQTRKKISKALKGKVKGIASTKEKEIERRRKISETMKKNPKAGGYRYGSGRGKQGWYKGYWCDSSWELAFVIYNLDHGIKFERNEEKFYYIFHGEEHYWLPDFIIHDTYYEIKGYEDEKAKTKHSSFQNPLKILKQNEMQKYIQYAEEKYGKNYIKIYDNYKVSKKQKLKKIQKEKNKKEKIQKEKEKKKQQKLKKIQKEKEKEKEKEKKRRQLQYKINKLNLIQKRKNDLLEIDLFHIGWIKIISEKWGVSHTQVKRWIKKNIPELEYYERNKSGRASQLGGGRGFENR